MIPFLLAVIIIFSLATLFLQWKFPTLLGILGERYVRRSLLKLDPATYTILNDLMLPSNGNTATTQIDHVVISNFGVFVLETKSYSGWIFGDEKREYWTQIIYRYRKRFYNPIRQNYAHMKAVETIVYPLVPRVPIYGFVIFPSADKLKIIGTDVVADTRSTIKKILEYKYQEITDVEKEVIINALTHANITDRNARKSHTRDVSALKYLSGL